MRVVEEFQRASYHARDLKVDQKSSVRAVGAPLIACASAANHPYMPLSGQHPHTHVQLIDKPMSQLQKALCWGMCRFWYRPERPLEPEIDKQTLFTTEIAPCTAIRPLAAYKNGALGRDSERSY